MITAKFPDDFEMYFKRKGPEPELPPALKHMLEEINVTSFHGIHWLLKSAESGETLISVIGGGIGHHGDGETTFEMWDYREPEPRSYLSAEEINEHILLHPFLDK